MSPPTAIVLTVVLAACDAVRPSDNHDDHASRAATGHVFSARVRGALPNLRDRDGDGVGWLFDCDDNDPRRFPGAADLADDGLDQDCDGYDATDLDLDGFSTPAGDCNDGDPAVSPWSPEVAANGIDDNCDGSIDEVDGGGVGGVPGDYPVGVSGCLSEVVPSCVDDLALPQDLDPACYLTLGFGAYNKYNGQYHLGYDVSCGSGNSDLGHPVLAPADGVVYSIVNGGPGWGWLVTIEVRLPEGRFVLAPDGSRLTVLYIMVGHVDGVAVAVGDQVLQGQQLAVLGDAGGSFSAARCASVEACAHAHWEVRTDPDFVCSAGPGYVRDAGLVGDWHMSIAEAARQIGGVCVEPSILSPDAGDVIPAGSTVNLGWVVGNWQDLDRVRVELLDATGRVVVQPAAAAPNTGSLAVYLDPAVVPAGSYQFCLSQSGAPWWSTCSGSFRVVGSTTPSSVGCVPGDHPTVQAAVDAARDGDTIDLCGTVSGLASIRGKELRLRGLGSVTWRADLRGALVARDGAVVTVEGVRFTGDARQTGYGVVAGRDADLVLRDVELSDVVTGAFGAVEITRGGLVADELVIARIDASAAFLGGGISANDATLDLRDLSVRDVEGADDAVDIAASTGVITDGALVDNEGTSVGGLRLDGSTLDLVRVDMTGNVAGGQGGGLFVGCDSVMRMHGGSLVDNAEVGSVWSEAATVACVDPLGEFGPAVLVLDGVALGVDGVVRVDPHPVSTSGRFPFSGSASATCSSDTGVCR